MEWILTQRYGYICWKRDENYNLWNHIKVWKNNDDEKSLVNEQEIFDGLSDLEKDMDESKPQWEIIVIPRVQGNLVITHNRSYSFLASNFKSNNDRIFKQTKLQMKKSRLL